MIPFEAFFVKSKMIAFWEKGEACKVKEENKIFSEPRAAFAGIPFRKINNRKNSYDKYFSIYEVWRDKSLKRTV